MADDIAVFYAARLDEDEHWARIADDPARALREVVAKRKILAAHPAADDEGQLFCGTCISDAELYAEKFGDGRWPCATVRATVAVWNDHEDYQEDWRP
jgi:hypothetical protein